MIKRYFTFLTDKMKQEKVLPTLQVAFHDTNTHIHTLSRSVYGRLRRKLELCCIIFVQRKVNLWNLYDTPEYTVMYKTPLVVLQYIQYMTLRYVAQALINFKLFIASFDGIESKIILYLLIKIWWLCSIGKLEDHTYSTQSRSKISEYPFNMDITQKIYLFWAALTYSTYVCVCMSTS